MPARASWIPKDPGQTPCRTARRRMTKWAAEAAFQGTAATGEVKRPTHPRRRRHGEDARSPIDPFTSSQRTPSGTSPACHPARRSGCRPAPLGRRGGPFGVAGAVPIGLEGDRLLPTLRVPVLGDGEIGVVSSSGGRRRGVAAGRGSTRRPSGRAVRAVHQGLAKPRELCHIPRSKPKPRLTWATCGDAGDAAETAPGSIRIGIARGCGTARDPADGRGPRRRPRPRPRDETR